MGKFERTLLMMVLMPKRAVMKHHRDASASYRTPDRKKPGDRLSMAVSSVSQGR